MLATKVTPRGRRRQMGGCRVEWGAIALLGLAGLWLGRFWFAFWLAWVLYRIARDRPQLLPLRRGARRLGRYAAGTDRGGR